MINEQLNNLEQISSKTSMHLIKLESHPQSNSVLELKESAIKIMDEAMLTKEMLEKLREDIE